jgi:hypothetical protein
MRQGIAAPMGALAPAQLFLACLRRGFEGRQGRRLIRRACPRWQQLDGVEQRQQRRQDVNVAARLARESRWTASMPAEDAAALVLC